VDELETEEDTLSEAEKVAAVLIDRRKELIGKLDHHKKRRDELNEAVKLLRASAALERDMRNDLNDAVGKIKQNIEELRQKLVKKWKSFQQIEEVQRDKPSIPPKWKLEQELQRLDWEQSTTPTLEMREREDQLIERVYEIKQILEEHNRLDAENDRRFKSLADSKAVEIDIRSNRIRLQELHKESQEHHERMLQFYRKADEEIKQADKAHTEFVEVLTEVKKIDAELDIVMTKVRALRGNLKAKDLIASVNKDKSLEALKSSLMEEARRKLQAGEKLSLDEMKLIYGDE
jgi:phosphoserine phosphatase